MFIYNLLAKIARHTPKNILRLRYYKSLQKPLKLNGPLSKAPDLQTYIMRSLIHNRANGRWALMADKYAVRDEVSRTIGAEHLIPLYGRWNRAEDIDFDALPDEYILKTNNGCGTNVVVHTGHKIDRQAIVQQMSRALHFPYPELSGQLHYSLIPPAIIAEKLMVQGQGRKSLTDYKIHCVNGVPQVIFVFCDRDEVDHFNYTVTPYTIRWQIIPPDTKLSDMPADAPVADDCPECLDQMLDMAARLSKGEEYVRVDFYIIGGQIYFGEMTYSPDTRFNARFDCYQGIFGDILDKIRSDRVAGISSTTF